MDTIKFTANATRVLDTANEKAQSCGEDTLTPMFLLYGLLSSKGGQSRTILINAGIDPIQYKIALTNYFNLGFDTQEQEICVSENIIDIMLLAKKLSFDSHRISVSPIDLLYAIFQWNFDDVVSILTDIGICYEQVQNFVETHCEHGKKKKLAGAKPSETSSNPELYDQGNLSHEGRKKSTAINKTSCKDFSMPPFLDKYGRDLSALAESGELDPVIGREQEIERVVRTLLRRQKSNPCLIGKAGVGKTAIVEGLAQRIAVEKVPDALKDKRIIELNLSAIIAGTKYRGDLEERITKLLDEVLNEPRIILFLDELHSVFDNSTSEGATNIANLFKPVLARGQLSLIGATTTEEYRKNIEKDSAFERRFQSITVDEPTDEETIAILRKLKPRYEKHHNLKIEDGALLAVVELSTKYITNRQLPDKAVDVLDETAAYLQLHNCSRMSKEHVAQVISEITSLPVGSITESEGKRLLALEERLHSRIVGQDDAVSTVARALRRNRAGMQDSRRPIGSFLFLGPTGVGKTELSLALSEALYLNKKSIVRLDMSEYMEQHSISKLLGAPPGYVGFDNGATLTERIARAPYCVLLLDEIEKAHPDVWNVLLQIMDNGALTDSTGKEVSFKNVTVIVTSNIGAHYLTSPTKRLGFSSKEDATPPQEQVMVELKKTLRPELLNRFDKIVVFDNLTMADTLAIVKKMTAKVAEKAKKLGITLTFTDKALEVLAEKGYDPAYGARPLRRVIQREVEDEIANLLLGAELQEGDCVVFSYVGEFRLQIKKTAVMESM